MFAHTSAISVKSHSLNAARWNPTASKFMEWLTSMITSREGQRYAHFVCGFFMHLSYMFHGPQFTHFPMAPGNTYDCEEHWIKLDIVSISGQCDMFFGEELRHILLYAFSKS